MQKARHSLLAYLVLVSLTSCSYFQFPGVYKIDVQQGNIVTQKMLDQLKLGMSKRQVRFVMGTPLVVDTFNQDRWDYFFSLLNPVGSTTEQHVTIFFKDDKLTHFSPTTLDSATAKAPEQKKQ